VPASVRTDRPGGATGRPLAPLPPATESIYEVAVDPADPDSVYVMGFAFHLDVRPSERQQGR
jgi:hypothetical protein